MAKDRKEEKQKLREEVHEKVLGPKSLQNKYIAAIFGFVE